MKKIGKLILGLGDRSDFDFALRLKEKRELNRFHEKLKKVNKCNVSYFGPPYDYDWHSKKFKDLDWKQRWMGERGD